jgi:hypothetical protein
MVRAFPAADTEAILLRRPYAAQERPRKMAQQIDSAAAGTQMVPFVFKSTTPREIYMLAALRFMWSRCNGP